ncbi:hypothetical protein [Rhizobium gallicum]|uniref:hypothetical protein n=1 Tax=Rhizobium gallicum TaxID=56730 RepID=UPI000A864665|nr:hypothetical protein [Rhizobium gallicum]
MILLTSGMHIYARGYNRWEWIVAEKSKAPIVSGEVTGARWKAVAEANAAMRRLQNK